jgi:hypothetical protein
MGQIHSIHLGEDGLRRARITCPVEMIPAPGQYLQAYDPDDPDVFLPSSLFASQLHKDGFTAAAPIPDSWHPGQRLVLRGPLGQGFHRPQANAKVALVGLDEHVCRLESFWYQHEGEIALFTDAVLPQLPVSVEANPMHVLPRALAWADSIIIDAPRKTIMSLRDLLGLEIDAPLPMNAQILIHSDMPCGGMAQCGVCSVDMLGKPKWTHACEIGPVYPLNKLFI